MNAQLTRVQCGVCGEGVELSAAVICHHCGVLLCTESTCRMSLTAKEFADGAPPAAHCPNFYQAHHTLPAANHSNE